MPKRYKGWLLGDAGYAQTESMMVIFLECDTPAQDRYNISYKKTRNMVENSIGVLKSRFRCLFKVSGGCIMFDPSSVCEIIV